MYFRVLQTVMRNDVCPRVVAVVCCPQIHVCTIHHIPKIDKKCITFRFVKRETTAVVLTPSDLEISSIV